MSNLGYEEIQGSPFIGLSSQPARSSFRAAAAKEGNDPPPLKIPYSAGEIESGLLRDTASSYRPSLPIYSFTSNDTPIYFFQQDIEVMMRDGCVITPLENALAPLNFAKWKIEGSSKKVVESYEKELKYFWNRSHSINIQGASYGWSGSEVVYDIEDNLLSQKEINTFSSKDVKALSVKGKFAGIRVTGTLAGDKHTDLHGSQKGVPSKCFWYAHNARYGQFYGNSQFLPAWRYWRRLRGRDGCEEILDLGTYRHALGVSIVRFPGEDFMATNKPNFSAAGVRVAAKDIARNLNLELRYGTGISMPSNNYNSEEGGGKKWDLEYKNASVNLKELADNCDNLERKIAMALGWPTELAEATESGSWGGREIPFINLLLRNTTIQRYIGKQWHELIGLPMVRWNFGWDAWVRCEPISLVEVWQNMNKKNQAANNPQPQTPPPAPMPPDAGENPSNSTALGDEEKANLAAYAKLLALGKQGDETAMNAAKNLKSKMGGQVNLSSWQRLPVGSKNPKTGRVVRSQNAWYNGESQAVDYFQSDPNKGGKPAQEKVAEDRSLKVEGESLKAEMRKMDSMNPQQLNQKAESLGAAPEMVQNAMKSSFLEAIKITVASKDMSPEEKYAWAKDETKKVAKLIGVDKKELRNEMNAMLKESGVKIAKPMTEEKLSQAKEAGKNAFVPEGKSDPSKNASGVLTESIDNSENAKFEEMKEKMSEVSVALSQGKPVDISGLPEEFVRSVSEAYLASKKEPNQEEKDFSTETPEEPKSPESAANEELSKDREQKKTAEEVKSGILPSPEQAANAAVKEKPPVKEAPKSKKQKNKELREAADKLLADAEAEPKVAEKPKESVPKDDPEKSTADGHLLSEAEVRQAAALVAQPPKSKGKAPKDYKPDLSPSGNKSVVLEPRGKEESDESFAARKSEYTANAKKAFDKSFAEHKSSGMSDEDARYEAALDNRLSESALKEISPIDKAAKVKKEKSAPALSESEIKRYKDEFGVDARGKTLAEANREVLKSKGIDAPEEEQDSPQSAIKESIESSGEILDNSPVKEDKEARKVADEILKPKAKPAKKDLPKVAESPKPEVPNYSGGKDVSDKPFGKENPWHGKRESSFAAMRLLSEESERNYEKARSLNPTGGQVMVGSADFDNILKATVIDGYLRALRNGLPPEKAFEQAKQDGNESVANWNKHGYKSRASFGGSHELKRWEKAGESEAENVHRKFLNSLSEDDRGVSESEKTVATEKNIRDTFRKLDSENPEDIDSKKAKFLDNVTGNKSKEVIAEFESASGNDRKYRIVPKYNSVNGLHFVATYDVPGDNIYDQDFSEKHESYEAAEKALGKHLATVKYGENMRVKSKLAESSRDEYREGVRKATEANRVAKEKEESDKEDKRLKNEEAKYRFKDSIGKEKGKKVTFNAAFTSGYGDDAKREIGEEISGTSYGNLAVHKEGTGKHAVYQVSHPKTGFKAVSKGFKTKEQAKEYAIALGKLDSFDFEDIKDMPKTLGRNPFKLMVAISDGEYADVEEILESVKKTPK